MNILLMVLLSTTLMGEGLLPHEGNKLVVEDWITLDANVDFKNCNNMIIGDLAAFAAWKARRTGEFRRVRITSCYRHRGNKNSDHYNGNACDWHLEYTDENVNAQYEDDFYSYLEFQTIIGRKKKISLGCYPFKRIIHTGHRGRPARWCWDEDDNQITMEEGLTIMDELANVD